MWLSGCRVRKPSLRRWLPAGRNRDEGLRLRTRLQHEVCGKSSKGALAIYAVWPAMCEDVPRALRRQERGGILVCRILHQRMLSQKHAIDDQDEL